MIIDDIKQANVQAMKDKDASARAIYGIIMSKYMQQTIEARAVGKEIGDAEMVKIIQKTIKKLDDIDNTTKLSAIFNLLFDFIENFFTNENINYNNNYISAYNS